MNANRFEIRGLFNYLHVFYWTKASIFICSALVILLILSPDRLFGIYRKMMRIILYDGV